MWSLCSHTYIFHALDDVESFYLILLFLLSNYVLFSDESLVITAIMHNDYCWSQCSDFGVFWIDTCLFNLHDTHTCEDRIGSRTHLNFCFLITSKRLHNFAQFWGVKCGASSSSGRTAYITLDLSPSLSLSLSLSLSSSLSPSLSLSISDFHSLSLSITLVSISILCNVFFRWKWHRCWYIQSTIKMRCVEIFKLKNGNFANIFVIFNDFIYGWNNIIKSRLKLTLNNIYNRIWMY